jgi:hypothetical protein
MMQDGILFHMVRRLQLTRHNSHGIHTDGIGVGLPDYVNNTPGLVETLALVASHGRVHPPT